MRPCPRPFLLLPADLNWGPQNWESVVLSSEPWQLLKESRLKQVWYFSTHPWKQQKFTLHLSEDMLLFLQLQHDLWPLLSELSLQSSGIVHLCKDNTKKWYTALGLPCMRWSGPSISSWGDFFCLLLLRDTSIHHLCYYHSNYIKSWCRST